jgi:hypothetical protein
LKSLSRNYQEALILFEELKKETAGLRLKQRLLNELVLTKTHQESNLEVH